MFHTKYHIKFLKISQCSSLFHTVRTQAAVLIILIKLDDYKVDHTFLSTLGRLLEVLCTVLHFYTMCCGTQNSNDLVY